MLLVIRVGHFFILFYAGDVFGFFSWFYMDLVMHNYTKEVTSQQAEAATPEESASTAKKAKQYTEPETKTVISFKSLAEMLKVDSSSSEAQTGLKGPHASHKAEDMVSFRDYPCLAPGANGEDPRLLHQLPPLQTQPSGSHFGRGPTPGDHHGHLQ